MRTLKTSEAAALLNVSANTLRAWERRFGYPKPQRSPGQHRLYAYGEIAALRDALQEGLSISSAVSVAREGLRSDNHALVGALSSFEVDRADAAMEAALALRSVERSVEEVLLPSLEELANRHGVDSAPWAFAARWGGEWLRRAQRLSPPPVRPISLIIGDASRDELDLDALYIRALELLSARAGLRVLCLSVRGVSAMTEALASARPNAVVLAGRYISDDEVARWAYSVRASAGSLPVALYRRGFEGSRLRTTGAKVLDGKPSIACRQLLELVEGEQLAPLMRPAQPAARARIGPQIPVGRRAAALENGQRLASVDAGKDRWP